ncbi:MAG: hypothetical protein H7235_03275 [Bdellovibrionaceae bacterium]|nr:hypothetical protein [Pseudobdellovibrionaceae bacterium]
MGPGYNDVTFLKRFIRHLARINYPSVVPDAEALNVLAKFRKFPMLPSNWILTPL